MIRCPVLSFQIRGENLPRDHFLLPGEPQFFPMLKVEFHRDRTRNPASRSIPVPHIPSQMRSCPLLKSYRSQARHTVARPAGLDRDLPRHTEDRERTGFRIPDGPAFPGLSQDRGVRIRWYMRHMTYGLSRD